MRLKSFYATTATEAMKMVRETLGEDAIIVATREEKGGKGGVRVTAAIEQHDHHSDFNPAHPEKDWIYGDDGNDENSVIEKLTDVMIRHSVPEDITDQVLSCAAVMGLEQAEISLIAALEHLFSFKPLEQAPTQTAHMLVGPPGAGKTLAVAKMAARAVMNNKKVGVISTDTLRAGGIEQLSAFTKLMNVDLKKAGSAQKLRDALEQFQDVDQIFVDTGGLNPFDSEEMTHLARLISAGNITPILTLPAGTDSEECGEIARIYATLGVTAMIPTRLDISRRLGGVLSAAYYGELLLTDASNTPKVADGLMSLSPQNLARLLLPESVKKHGKLQAPSRKKQMVNAG